MQAGVGLLILDVMPIWWSLPGYRHNYLKFYQLPNSNLFTRRMLFFSIEATSEIYGPRVSSYNICLRDLFLFAFIFRSINPKTQNTLLYFFYFMFPWDLFIQSIIFFSRPCDNFWHHYPKGIDNPFNTLGCEYLLFVCRCCLHSVAWSRCQNWKISGRGSRIVRLGSMVTGDGGHDVYPGSPHDH